MDFVLKNGIVSLSSIGARKDEVKGCSADISWTLISGKLGYRNSVLVKCKLYAHTLKHRGSSMKWGTRKFNKRCSWSIWKSLMVLSGRGRLGGNAQNLLLWCSEKWKKIYKNTWAFRVSSKLWFFLMPQEYFPHSEFSNMWNSLWSSRLFHFPLTF